MIKAILFDIDGVLLRPPHYFGKELELRGYMKAVECLYTYYGGNDDELCLRGKAEIEDVFMPYIQKFGWKETVREYLQEQYAFETQFLDNELIDFVYEMKKKGIICCLATDQDKHRAVHLLETCQLQDIFDTWFISCYIGYRKIHSEYWESALDQLKKTIPGIKPEEIIFFDDREENIKRAASFGIYAILFDDTTDVKKLITHNLHFS